MISAKVPFSTSPHQCTFVVLLGCTETWSTELDWRWIWRCSSLPRRKKKVKVILRKQHIRGLWFHDDAERVKIETMLEQTMVPWWLKKLIRDIVGQSFFPETCVVRIYVSQTLNVVVWEGISGYIRLLRPPAFCWGSFWGRAAEQGRESWSSVASRWLMAANFEVATSLSRYHRIWIFGWNLNLEAPKKGK